MKQLTETFKQPTGPMNTSWVPGGYQNAKKSTPSGLNLTSYAAFTKQMIN